MNTDPTLEYYNENAVSFTENTRDVDFSETRDRFLAQLPEGSRILDFGCGSGRDTKSFLMRGYQAEALDGSEELCRLAAAYTGIRVTCMRFQEFQEHRRYDGIWACASILHLPSRELAKVMHQLACALKDGGLLYVSFKYGTEEGVRNGRYFTDMTGEKLEEFLQEIPELCLCEQWVTSDVRPGRETERWLNVFLRKRQT